MSYKLVIFDFDGTLADSMGWLGGTLNQVAERYGFRVVGEDEMHMLRGRDHRAIIRYLGVPAWKMPLIANHMRKLAAKDAARIKLFPDAGALLQILSDRGVAIAIVSSNAEDNVRRILGAEHASLVRYYECGASMFGKAARFRRVLARSGIAREETICIGDETRDIEAARRERLPSGAVTWGYATEEVLRAHDPTHVFDSMGEIMAAVSG